MGNNSLCKLNKDEILCGGTIDGVIKVISISEKKIIYKINNHFFWHDLDALSEFGFCSGIDNYTRHFDGRKEGECPYTLFDYLSDDVITFIDESHATIPQINGMFNWDRRRKETLVEYGFPLPSALDNRPLRFKEFLLKQKSVICTSATPGEYELSKIL